MPTEQEYAVHVGVLEHNGLVALWESIKAGHTDDSNWSPGKAFEYLVLRAFQIEGAEVCWPYSVHVSGMVVEQIDGVVYTEGLACVVESKDWKDQTGFGPIAKLRSVLLRRPVGTVGLLFSRSGFTEAARRLAEFLAPQTILLWSGTDVTYALTRETMIDGLRLKYRYAIEHALPEYRLTEEEKL